MNFGQTCHAGTRIYVHEDVYEEFVAAYTKRMSSLKVGDNFDESVDQGPQNSKMQYEKILGYIESGKQDGATVSLGGEVAEVEGVGGKGYYIQPTVFTDVKPDMKVCDPTRSSKLPLTTNPRLCAKRFLDLWSALQSSRPKRKSSARPTIRPTALLRRFTPRTTSVRFALRMD